MNAMAYLCPVCVLGTTTKEDHETPLISLFLEQLPFADSALSGHSICIHTRRDAEYK